MESIIYDVDIASDVKNFLISNSQDVDFDNVSLKKEIMDLDDDTLIRIGKIINSPTKIVSVQIVDASFFKYNLYKKDGNKD